MPQENTLGTVDERPQGRAGDNSEVREAAQKD